MIVSVRHRPAFGPRARVRADDGSRSVCALKFPLEAISMSSDP
jgi:hypothetical protein